MTQEELAQLKELLNKAKVALPKGTHFSVEAKDDALVLVGEDFYIWGGEWNDYRLESSGEVTHKSGVIH